MKFEELKIRNNAQDLYVNLHKALEKTKHSFFRQESLRLAMAVSTAIAQGFERFSKTDFIVFLQKAKSNLAGLKNMLHLGHRLEALTKEQLDDFVDKCGMNAAMTQNYIKSLNTPKNTSENTQ